jgi:hypothetical protein
MATVAAPTATAIPAAPWSGTRTRPRATQTATPTKLLTSGRMRWPVISTIGVAGPTIASAARAATRM